MNAVGLEFHCHNEYIHVHFHHQTQLGLQVTVASVTVQYHLPYLQNQPLQPPKEAASRNNAMTAIQNKKQKIMAFLKVKGISDLHDQVGSNHSSTQFGCNIKCACQQVADCQWIQQAFTLLTVTGDIAGQFGADGIQP